MGFDVGLIHQVQMPTEQQICVGCPIHKREALGLECCFERGVDPVPLEIGQLSGVITGDFTAQGIKAYGFWLTKVVVGREVDHRFGGLGSACCDSEQHQSGGGVANQFHVILRRDTSDTPNVAGLPGHTSAQHDTFFDQKMLLGDAAIMGTGRERGRLSVRYQVLAVKLV